MAVNVTNYYNLVTAQRMIEKIRSTADIGLRVLVGGSAFDSNPQGWMDIGADRLVQTCRDIEKLSREDQGYETSI